MTREPVGGAGAGTGDKAAGERYRCTGCGNLTRFDVVATRRTRSFHHFSVGGDLTVEDEDVLDERIEQVTCRWCGASGDAIERGPFSEPAHDRLTGPDPTR